MNVKQEEMRIKLDILDSLARSQKAMARIMENVAELSQETACADQASDLLACFESMAKVQVAMAEKMGLLAIRPVRTGEPEQPWLAPELRQQKLSPSA